MLENIQSEKGACGLYKDEQTYKQYDFSQFSIIFSWKKAPAAAIKDNKM